MLMLGAVAAFVALGAAAQGPRAMHQPLVSAPPTVLGNAHVPSAGLALCAVWAIDHSIDGPAAWLCTGFAATGVYLLVCAIQQVALDAFRNRSGPTVGPKEASDA